MTAGHIAMLLGNGYRPDPRVLKEARTLTQAGYRVTVIAWDREGDLPAREEKDGLIVRRVQNVRSSYGAGARQMLRLPRFWRQAWRMLNQEQPDAVHCHDFDTLIPGLLWARLHRRPVVYDAHDYYADMQAPRLHGLAGEFLVSLIEVTDQTLSRWVDAVITVDERIARRYHNPRTVIIGHYPPLDFAPAESRAGDGPEDGQPTELSRSVPGAFASDASDQTLIYAGRLSMDRGLLVVAQVMNELALRGIYPRLRLLGTWTSPAEQRAFEEAMAGLEDQLDDRGWVPFEQVSAALSRADVALAVLQPVPRYTKAVPVKLMEYMACGLPVVISDFPYNRALVEDAQCGLLVDPEDVEGVTDAVAHLLIDRRDAAILGRNGAAAFRDRYNWEALAPRLLALYDSLLT